MGKSNVYKIEIFGYTYYKATTTKARAKDELAKELAKRYKPETSETRLKKFMKVTKVG